MNKYVVIAQEYQMRFRNILTGKWAYKLQEISGLSQEEINAIEMKYNISLPLSYKVFLSNFANIPKSFLLDLDMGDEHPLEMTTFFYDAITFAEGEHIPPKNIPLNMFVFATYLYEHFYFFYLDDSSEDPVVYLANIFQGGDQPFKFEKIGESIWEFLEEGIAKYEIGKKEGRYFVDK
jgi:SMI1 / KNR4 family (SUKH-1)